MMKHIAVFVFILCIAFLAADAAGQLTTASSTPAEVNPKSISSATISITKTGTLIPSGNIQSASLSLCMAQESPCQNQPAGNPRDCQQSMDVSPGDWEYVNDASGNMMVRIHFKNLSQPQSYSLVQVVKTVEKRLDAEAPLDGGLAYTTETIGAPLTTNVSATAYPFERTLAGVAAMTAWVHDYVAYDISVFGKNMPSDWVLANRRGVCVEFSNLLVALLRSKDIATRYVNGYALSNEYKGFLTHEWVEVLAGGKWVSFDPTWLEGGLLDATHVVTSRSTDGIEKETLSYFGNGNINWSKGFDAVRMTDYSSNNDTSISIDAPQNLPVVGGGYL